MSKTSWLLSSTALIGLVGASAAGATDVGVQADGSAQIDATATKPAVFGLNAKIDLRGGIEDDTDFYAGVGSFAMPLGDPFGLQVDGLLGTLDGELSAAAAVHLFWRDPDLVMLGAYADVGHAEADGAGTIGRAAAEAEVYLGPLTASALIGGQFGDLGEGFFSEESVSFYPIEDLRLYGTHRYQPDDVGHSGAIGAEWLAPLAGHGLALFAEGRVDEDGDWGVQGGLRLYFGSQNSLVKRHREEDPPDHFDLFLQAAAAAASAGPAAADAIIE